MADNRINPNGTFKHKPVIRKVPTSSVSYGESLTHKSYLWEASSPPDDCVHVVVVAASSKEARALYFKARTRERLDPI